LKSKDDKEDEDYLSLLDPNANASEKEKELREQNDTLQEKIIDLNVQLEKANDNVNYLHI